MKEFLLVLLCYILGSIPFSYIFSRYLGGVDIRSRGTGNVGATNVLRTLGIKIAVASLLGDLLKGVLAAWLGFASWGWRSGGNLYSGGGSRTLLAGISGISRRKRGCHLGWCHTGINATGWRDYGRHFCHRNCGKPFCFTRINLCGSPFSGTHAGNDQSTLAISDDESGYGWNGFIPAPNQY